MHTAPHPSDHLYELSAQNGIIWFISSLSGVKFCPWFKEARTFCKRKLQENKTKSAFLLTLNVHLKHILQTCRVKILGKTSVVSVSPYFHYGFFWP